MQHVCEASGGGGGGEERRGARRKLVLARSLADMIRVPLMLLGVVNRMVPGISQS